MRQILFGLGRFAVISLVSFGAATYANWRNHESYWNGTIHRVQTTDFNMASHMLPTKLSYALVEKNIEEVQRTLDSNYGLFGLVVTNCTTVELNCPNQKILYSSNSEREWRKQLTVKTLADAPYSILRNPPPLLTEAEMASTRNPIWKATGKINSGQIIGRVYYVRGISPEFQASYQKWLQNLPNSFLLDSGAQKYYSLTIGLFGVIGLAAFIALEFLLHHKQVRERRLQEEKEQIREQLDQSEKQLSEQLHQISCLIAENEQFVQELSVYQKQEAIQEKILSTLQEEKKQYKQTIFYLQQYIQQNQDKDVDVMRLQQELEAVKQQNQIAEKNIQDYEIWVNELQEEKERLSFLLQTKTETIAELKEKERQYSEKLHLLEKQKESLSQKEGLNQFEDSVLRRLRRSLRYQARYWRIYPQFDVGQGTRSRQATDFIVICQSCVFVIEAKFYLGKISAEGDVRNTAWTCKTRAGARRMVRSSSGENPYKQVLSYTNGMLGRINLDRAGGRIGVYGIIVFPEGTNIRNLQSGIGGYYRVTTLGKLIQVIQELEITFIRENQHQLSPLSIEQLDDLIHGKPVRGLPQLLRTSV